MPGRQSYGYGHSIDKGGLQVPGDVVTPVSIDPDSNIIISFSEPVNPATVTNVGDGSGSFEVYNNTTASWVAGVLSTSDNTQYTFNPTSDFDFEDSVTVHLTSAIQTPGGDPYTGPFEIEYQVVAEFDPLTLSPHAWYDNSDPTTLFIDAGITPVSLDNDPIYQQNDKSGNNYPLLQETSLARQLYKTAVKNGLSIAAFDGIDDFTRTINPTNPAYSGAYTTYCVFQLPVTGVKPVFGIGTAFLYGNASNEFILTKGVPTDISAFVRTTSYMILKIVTNGAATTIQKNDGPIVTGESSDPGFTQFRLGNGLGLYGPINHCESIIFPGAISGANDESVKKYLNYKWSIY
jgi:hypothetical protein